VKMTIAPIARFFVNVFDFFFFYKHICSATRCDGRLFRISTTSSIHSRILFFSMSPFSLLSLSLSFSFALSLHQHTTNDIIIWAFHSLLALCINHICAQYCACTSNSIYLSIFLSSLCL